MKSIYTILSGIKFLAGNYALKFLFVAFLGIHIPLLGIIAAIAWGSSSAVTILFTAIICTLLACSLTLYILKSLLDPLHYTYLALNCYLDKRELPHLPLQYPDEAGRLMQRTQITIQRLDSLLKEKDELAALFSHDVRTPLANICGLSNLIQQENDITSMHTYSAEITKLAESQLQFLKDILDKMRVTGHQREIPVFKEVPVELLIQKANQMLLPQLSAKNISIINEIDPALVISVDQEQISHVFLNLMTNAIKFSNPGSYVLLTADSNHQFIRLHITDQGIGFDKSEEKELFKLYTSLSRKGTAGEPSMGMGLYLSKKIMEKHGGCLYASSDGPGQGAVFTMSFPMGNNDLNTA